MKSDASKPGATIVLDPRTEELLREIAADERSCLLRSSRRELDDALERFDYRGLDTQVGLSLAERELLRTARAEVAYWLNVICFRRLTEDEETKYYCTRLIEGDREYIPPSTEDIRAGARAAIDSAAELGVDDLSAAQLLLLAATPNPTAPNARPPSVRALAAASLRMQPTFQARFYAIQSMIRKGTTDTAIAHASCLLDGASNRIQAAYAHALAGTALSETGLAGKAISHYLSAWKSSPRQIEFPIRALIASIDALDPIAASHCARQVEAQYVNATTIEAITTSLVNRRWRPAPTSQGIISELRNRGSATLQAIVHALRTN